MTNRPSQNRASADNKRTNAPNDTEHDSAHMGATEDQVVPLTPPTEAIDKLVDNPYDDNPDRADELTPG